MITSLSVAESMGVATTRAAIEARTTKVGLRTNISMIEMDN